MSKIKLLGIAVIGLLIINIAIVCFLFFRKPPHPPEGIPPMMEQAGPKNIIIQRLHFDKDQVAAYEDLIEAHQSSIKLMDDSIRHTRWALYQTLSQTAFEGKDSLLNRLALLQQKIELIHYDHFAGIKKICRPDQLDNFNELSSDLARLFAPAKNNPPPPKD